MQVVGRAEPHNLRLGHPEQKRVMTIRENARTQVRCACSCALCVQTICSAACNV